MNYNDPREYFPEKSKDKNASIETQNYGETTRLFDGIVRNMHDDFGFIEAKSFEEDIFFQFSHIRGDLPKVKDSVVGEAIYVPNMPFKWNATRVQKVFTSLSKSNEPDSPMTSFPHMNKEMQTMANSPNMTPFKDTFGVLLKDAGVWDPWRDPLGLFENRNRKMKSQYDVYNNPMGRMNQIQMKGPTVDNNYSRFQRGQFNEEIEKTMEQTSPLIKARNITERLGRRKRGQKLKGNREIDHIRDKSSKRMRQGSESVEYQYASRTRLDRMEDFRKGITKDGPDSKKEIVNLDERKKVKWEEKWKSSLRISKDIAFPTASLTFLEGSVCSLKSRYQKLYIPTEFIRSDHVWTQSFPLHEPLNIFRDQDGMSIACNFHISNGECNSIGNDHEEKITKNDDVSHTFKAKVMLLAMPPSEHLLHMIWKFNYGSEDDSYIKSDEGESFSKNSCINEKNNDSSKFKDSLKSRKRVPYVCKICNVICHSAATYDLHRVGHKHEEASTKEWLLNNINVQWEKKRNRYGDGSRGKANKCSFGG